MSAHGAGPDLWLARHGETEWSRNGRHTGRTDLPLTKEGERAAGLLVARLSDVHFDLVISSPLQRARRTAELAGFADPTIEPDAREWDYGDYEGITTDEIRLTDPGWTVWAHGSPGGETPAQVGERADRIVEKVRTAAAERAIVFAHGHFLRVLAARWLAQEPSQGAHYRLDTATVSVLGWERVVPVILKWNS